MLPLPRHPIQAPTLSHWIIVILLACLSRWSPAIHPCSLWFIFNTAAVVTLQLMSLLCSQVLAGFPFHSENALSPYRGLGSFA